MNKRIISVFCRHIKTLFNPKSILKVFLPLSSSRFHLIWIKQHVVIEQLIDQRKLKNKMLLIEKISRALVGKQILNLFEYTDSIWRYKQFIGYGDTMFAFSENTKTNV